MQNLNLVSCPYMVLYNNGPTLGGCVALICHESLVSCNLEWCLSSLSFMTLPILKTTDLTYVVFWARIPQKVPFGQEYHTSDVSPSKHYIKRHMSLPHSW